MNSNKEKLEAQKRLANLFFEMGMDEDVVSCVTGLSKEETNNIKSKSKSDKKQKDTIDIKK